MALKTAQKIEALKILEITKEQPKQHIPKKLNIKKIILLVIGSIVAALILVGIGWFFGHQAMVNGN